jgi:phosphoglucomutase
METSPLAGKPADPATLIDVPKLLAAYYSCKPDPSVLSQRVAFGTSGHRGCSLDNSFNEAHILAITQAICLYRRQQKIDGPLYIGFDTHALSEPAFHSALEVLAANGVDVMVDAANRSTPTPVISHAILTHNRDYKQHLADGIVITPSHNPPRFGGFKYDPPHGGPADTHVTEWIETQANTLILDGLKQIARMPIASALTSTTTHKHDYLDGYVSDLPSVVDLQAIRDKQVHIGVDPLGGASVAYWDAIGERYGLNLEVVNHIVDPRFGFMTVDWDGQIRMDPSSAYAMARMVGLKDRFDVAFASDTDADRHGIVSHSQGLLDPNHYLAVAISYLFVNRPSWSKAIAVGKTIVSSSIIDRVAASLNRRLIEVPVGFKWFVESLIDGSVGFCGEESSGATFLRRNATVWTTDKDGLVPNLLAAEITARTGSDPGDHYRKLTSQFGEPLYERVDAPATPEEKERLGKLSADAVAASKLAGEPIRAKLTKAPGNGSAIGGLKVITDSGWFAARPSGTESIYKIYGESFKDREHLNAILHEAEEIVNKALQENP